MHKHKPRWVTDEEAYNLIGHGFLEEFDVESKWLVGYVPEQSEKNGRILSILEEANDIIADAGRSGELTIFDVRLSGDGETPEWLIYEYED